MTWSIKTGLDEFTQGNHKIGSRISRAVYGMDGRRDKHSRDAATREQAFN